MPSISRLMIKTALLYLVAGFSVGSVLLIGKAFGAPAGQWLPAHIEFLIVGFVIQFTLGVAFWMFPRLATITDRGKERPLWAAFLLINAGVACCALAPLAGIEQLTVLGRLFELIAMIGFAVNLWPRIYAFGKT